jgi:CRP-like cAMP-binding protein
MSSREGWREVAAAGAWFAGLPSNFAEALLAMATPVLLAEGQRLFARGDAPDGLYCILR